MYKFDSVLRGTAILTLGRVSGYGLSFLRNVILARALTKADFGLVSVLGMAMLLLEVGGRMAFGQQIIQSRHGDTSRFQATAHSLQFLRGVCSAALIIVFSLPLARFFEVRNAWWALAACACVPLCLGLSHLDIARRQRQMDYLPLVLIDVVPQFLVTAVAWPLAIWLGDYRVVVWLIIGKAVIGAALTFAFAQRPYRWAWEREHLRSMIGSVGLSC
jgi:O-antigen/teichoic acid export membrane protein